MIWLYILLKYNFAVISQLLVDYTGNYVSYTETIIYVAEIFDFQGKNIVLKAN